MRTSLANLGCIEVQEHLFPMPANGLLSVADLKPLMLKVPNDGITVAQPVPLLMYSFESLNEVVMKRVWVAVLALAAMSSWGMTLDEARKNIPELSGLNDESALNVIHQVYYPHMDKADLAARLGVKLPDSKAPKPKLGPIDQWRYESCQKDAAQAPTVLGVNTGLRLCREKFGQ